MPARTLECNHEWQPHSTEWGRCGSGRLERVLHMFPSLPLVAPQSQQRGSERSIRLSPCPQLTSVVLFEFRTTAGGATIKGCEAKSSSCGTRRSVSTPQCGHGRRLLASPSSFASNSIPPSQCSQRQVTYRGADSLIYPLLTGSPLICRVPREAVTPRPRQALTSSRRAQRSSPVFPAR